MSRKKKFDVVIIGGGIAGCHLAQLLVQHNFSVVLVDHKPIDKAGPHWINAVPLWMFDEAGLSRPKEKEIFDLNERFIIRAPDKKTRLFIEKLGVADVHMKLLGGRLKKAFQNFSSGNHFIQAHIVQGIYDKAQRLIEVEGELQDKQRIRISAKLFVDASGFKAILRRTHPQSKDIWPNVLRKDLCTAAQMTLEIKDREGAMTYLEKNLINPGDILSDVGFMGGYSLFRAQIDKDISHISLLCGVRGLPQYEAAHLVIKKFLSNNPWIGAFIIDGRGVIPIVSCYKKLASFGLALLGDAACQVYAAHGSGIGMGLIAAKMLATAICTARDKNIDIGSLEALKKYQSDFHQKYYGRLYFSEHFRRFSETLEQEKIADLITSGLFSSELVRQTLLQKEASMSLAIMKSLIQSALKSPQTFFSMLPVFKKAIIGKLLAKRL
jgi:menaquinone-9 beta-reductase